MYDIARQDAAQMLGVSTRSIDRYIKSGKLRAKKDGKVVFVNREDLEHLQSPSSTAPKQEVIYEKPEVTPKAIVPKSDSSAGATLEKIYDDLRTEIKKKDELIQTLSMRVGKSEEVAKNSVSLIEFKKSQFLLEESKNSLHKNIEDIEKEKEDLQRDLKHEKTTNTILIFFVFLLLIVAGVIWFMSI